MHAYWRLVFVSSDGLCTTMYNRFCMQHVYRCDLMIWVPFSLQIITQTRICVNKHAYDDVNREGGRVKPCMCMYCKRFVFSLCTHIYIGGLLRVFSSSDRHIYTYMYTCTPDYVIREGRWIKPYIYA